MSPKVEAPAPGTAIKETKFTELVSADKSNGNEERSYDALDYMEKMKPEDWASVTAYLYRVEPPVWRGGDSKTQVTQFTNFFDMMDVQRQYGGGVWRILLRNTKTKERLADSKHSVAGTPRDLTRETQEFSAGSSNGTTATETGGVVSQAMNIVSDPNARQAQTQMLLNSAAASIDLVKQNAAPQLTVKDILELAEKMNSRGAEKPFLETEVGKIVVAAASALVTALVQRVVTPTDPLDQLTKMATVMNSLGAGSSSGDWKAALVNAAPQIANALKDTVHEMRLGTEAQAGINASRTLTAASPPPIPPATAGVPAQQNPANGNVVEMPTPQSQPIGVDQMQLLDIKLVELLNDPKMTGDKAAEILYQTWPDFVDEISNYNVDAIINAMNVRPFLKPHIGNPRLRQFLTEFLQWANEADAPPAAPGA